MTTPSSGPAGPPVPPDAPDPPPPRRLRLGDLLVALGGLFVFGFSFAPFVQYSEQARESLFGQAGLSTSFNAWSMETFMVPLTTFVIVATLLGIAAVAVRFTLRRDPHLLGFRLRQLEVGLAMFAVVVLLGMVASDKHLIAGARQLAEADPSFRLDEVRLDTGWGAVLMLVGALISLVGALLNHLGVGPTVPVGPRPAAPAAPPGAPPPGAWQARQPAEFWQGGSGPGFPRGTPPPPPPPGGGPPPPASPPPPPPPRG